RWVASFGDLARGNAGVDRGDRASSGERGQESAALFENDGVSLDAADTRERRAGEPEQPVVHPPEDFAHGNEIVLRDEFVAVAERAGDRVVDGEKAVARPARDDGR